MIFAGLRKSWFSKLATHKKIPQDPQTRLIRTQPSLATWLKCKGNGRRNSALFHSKTTNRTSRRLCPLHGIIILSTTTSGEGPEAGCHPATTPAGERFRQCGFRSAVVKVVVESTLPGKIETRCGGGPQVPLRELFESWSCSSPLRYIRATPCRPDLAPLGGLGFGN
jgi:hypothetical protein